MKHSSHAIAQPFLWAIALSLTTALPAIAQLETDTWAEANSRVLLGQGQIDSLDDRMTLETSGREMPFDTWSFYGEAGDHLRVSVRSTDFDTIVILGAIQEQGLEVVAANDDINSETTNSQVEIRIHENREYLIGVLPYEPSAQGTYTVEVVQLVQPQPSAAENLNQTLEEAQELNRVMREYMWFSPTDPFLYP